MVADRGPEHDCASISEEQDTIMDVVEPYLLQLGFLDRTAQGRIATRSAYDHLKLEYRERGPAEVTIMSYLPHRRCGLRGRAGRVG